MTRKEIREMSLRCAVTVQPERDMSLGYAQSITEEVLARARAFERYLAMEDERKSEPSGKEVEA